MLFSFSIFGFDFRTVTACQAMNEMRKMMTKRIMTNKIVIIEMEKLKIQEKKHLKKRTKGSTETLKLYNREQ